MHELYGKFALSLLEGSGIDNSGQSGIFTALKYVVLQCTVACIVDVERGRGIGRKGKKGTLVLPCVSAVQGEGKRVLYERFNALSPFHFPNYSSC